MNHTIATTVVVAYVVVRAVSFVTDRLKVRVTPETSLEGDPDIKSEHRSSKVQSNAGVVQPHTDLETRM